MKLDFKEEPIGERKVRVSTYYRGKLVGAFEASVDREKYKNVCVTDFEFERRDIMSRTFKHFSQKEGLPIYFKLSDLDSRKRLLKKLGAKEVEDTDNVTIWWEDEDNRVLKWEF